MWNGIGWYGFIGPTTSTTDISLGSVPNIRFSTYYRHTYKISLIQHRDKSSKVRFSSAFQNLTTSTLMNND